MARALHQDFLKWLKEDKIGLLETISQYECLDMQFSEGNAIKVYFKGFLILTISDKIMNDNDLLFSVLRKEYFINKPGNNRIQAIIQNGVNIYNLQEYLDYVIGFLSRRNNTRVEESIRQEIARVNNRSREANDTDYFVVSEEYKINGPKFDLVTIRWSSDNQIRKKFNSNLKDLEIVVFELKHGVYAVGGSKDNKTEQADLKKHLSDFYSFIEDDVLFSRFKLDIVKMFVQQVLLKGFYNEKKIGGLKHVKSLSDSWNEKEIVAIANNIPVKFGVIMSDYKQQSSRLKEQIDMTSHEFLFATASFMGYGLYSNSMLNREQLLSILS